MTTFIVMFGFYPLLRCTLYWDLFMILVVFPELMTWLYFEVYAIFRCDVLC